MNAIFLTENLQKKISFAFKAISSKSQLPILSCFLLRVTENGMDILATDLEIGIQTKVIGKIIKTGEIAVPAKTLNDLISSLPNGEVELKLVENNLEIKTEKTRTLIQIQPLDDFPSLFEEKGEKILSIKAGELKEKLTKVVFSTAVETTRPVLEGVLFESKEGFVNLVATDGYRLSLDKIKTEEKKEVRIIIPTKILKESFLFDETAIVDIFIFNHNNQLIFSCMEGIIVGRLIDGEFPVYEKIIPRETSSKSFFLKADFQKAIKSCSVFARESASVIKMELLNNKLKISSKTASLGETSFEFEAGLKGEENEIAFNPRFLSELLSNIDSDELSFEMTGPLNPGAFKLKEDLNFIHIIMPIKM